MATWSTDNETLGGQQACTY